MEGVKLINLMKADMYRIFRGKAIFIIFAIMLSVIILTVYVFRSAPIVVGGAVIITDDPQALEGTFLEGIASEAAAPVETMSGAVASQMALGSMDILIMLYLEIFSIIA